MFLAVTEGWDLWHFSNLADTTSLGNSEAGGQTVPSQPAVTAAPMASCYLLLSKNPSFNLVNIKHATVLQSNAIRWPINVLLVGIVSDKIQLTETEMQPTWAQPTLS